MPSISPSTAAWVNLVFGIAGAILLYLSKTTLPAPVSPDVAAAVQAWSGWLAGAGAAAVAAANVYLHAVSADKPGPLAK